MDGINKNNVYPNNAGVSLKMRENLNMHNSLCIWFTGLSGSGKSTLANILELRLHEENIRTYLLDGDNLRTGINDDLNFSDGDRKENIRRTGEIAKLFVDAGVVVIASLISPFQRDRNLVKGKIQEGKFIEVFVDCDLETCERRDPKNLYKRARENAIANFTGISSPYEKPVKPDLQIKNGDGADINENVDLIFRHVLRIIRV